jgi:anti-sigma factor RsiW
MMRPDPETLSAYLDGEVSAPFDSSIARAIEDDPISAARYERLKRLHSALPAVSEAAVEQSAARSWLVIQRTLEGRPARHHRLLQIPVPAVAAAAAAIVILAGALVWSFAARSPLPGEQLLAGSRNVDVTIQVSNGEMEQVLNWLSSQDMLGEVNIQLPEQQFTIVGEPVLVKAAAYSGEPDR